MILCTPQFLRDRPIAGVRAFAQGWACVVVAGGRVGRHAFTACSARGPSIFIMPFSPTAFPRLSYRGISALAPDVRVVIRVQQLRPRIRGGCRSWRSSAALAHRGALRAVFRVSTACAYPAYRSLLYVLVTSAQDVRLQPAPYHLLPHTRVSRGQCGFVLAYLTSMPWPNAEACAADRAENPVKRGYLSRKSETPGHLP